MKWQRTVKKGKIIPNGVSLERHENDTAVFFTNLGHDVELIPPVLTPNSKSPDFMMDGLAWEMKSPLGSSKNTIERLFRKAAKQSENIIMDLRRTKFEDAKSLEICEKLFHASKRIKRMKVITRSCKLKDYARK